jgi:Domain of unknown function (DUF1772)
VAVAGVVRFVAVLSAGLIAGILLGDRMGATFARPALSASSFVTFQQVLHMHFVPMMPILMGIAMVSSVAWLMLVRARPSSAEFVLAALAALAWITVFVLTRAINVPINVELMKWEASLPPEDVREIWARWEGAHTVRTVVAVLGFALAIVALGKARNARAA